MTREEIAKLIASEWYGVTPTAGRYKESDWMRVAALVESWTSTSLPLCSLSIADIEKGLQEASLWAGEHQLARCVQGWLAPRDIEIKQKEQRIEELKAELAKAKELRMVPGPPPTDMAGLVVVQWQETGCYDLLRDGNAWRLVPNNTVAAHLPWPILPYEPPKPLTESEASFVLRGWMDADPSRAVVSSNKARSLFQGTAALKKFAGPLDATVIAAAKWIRAQGGAT